MTARARFFSIPLLVHPQGTEVSKRLLTLRQNNSSVASHAIYFHILALESGLDKSVLKWVFLQGLAENI